MIKHATFKNILINGHDDNNVHPSAGCNVSDATDVFANSSAVYVGHQKYFYDREFANYTCPVARTIRNPKPNAIVCMNGEWIAKHVPCPYGKYVKFC